MSSVPKERLTAYQRWELDSFDSTRRTAQTVTLPTAEQLAPIRQQARQEGFDAGYAEGIKQAAAETARLGAIVIGLAGRAHEIDERLAEDLLSLSLAIAKQVLRDALKVHPELILASIQEALGRLPHAHRRTHLIVHPQDATLVRERLGERLARTGTHIVEDARITPGGCRLETPECEIDATLESRWHRVAAAMGGQDDWIA